MPVSRTIIDHHDGCIGVSAELGVGSTFFFELKLSSSHAMQEAFLSLENGTHEGVESPHPSSPPYSALASSIPQAPTSMINLGHRLQRVLVVDDSKLNRKMLCRQLKDHFIEVVEVREPSNCPCLSL
jgi:PleD family two-component response regulator